MNFVDFAEITVIAGKGGDGCVSFRREKYIPKGGPDGGDGGKGGDIILQCSVQLHTLHDLRYNKIYHAQNGHSGMGANKSGKSGKNVTILLPAGTIVKDADSGEIICDLTKDGELFVIVKGGNGGFGNQHFASSTHQTPRFAKSGLAGEEKKLQLELKVLADVGLVGFPNAGKSTLLSVMSAARPKIADYPFTTLTPNLGIVKYGDLPSFVMADIPGLIEGAHLGKGLGDQFLRHIERNRLLLFLVESCSEDILQDYEILKNELRAFNPALLKIPRVLILSKWDILNEYPIIQAESGLTVIPISSVTRYNLDLLAIKIHNILSAI
ncbi:MAG TPA: GTPase ObgE [Candidatus Marinimicrobia bacterium]|nr:GTPase ObgE [Candidatus Neomarinimicrobiota bacterium]